MPRTCATTCCAIRGFSADQIAVKTERAGRVEGGGRSRRPAPRSVIRFIITKQALQEGWDCSFAYVLTILTNPGSRTALTQLVWPHPPPAVRRQDRIAALDER